MKEIQVHKFLENGFANECESENENVKEIQMPEFIEKIENVKIPKKLKVSKSEVVTPDSDKNKMLKLLYIQNS